VVVILFLVQVFGNIPLAVFDIFAIAVHFSRVVSVVSDILVFDADWTADVVDFAKIVVYRLLVNVIGLLGVLGEHGSLVLLRADERLVRLHFECV